MFDKYRSLTQSSAFRRQRRPASHTAHLSQPKPFPKRSLPNKAGSNGTHLKSASPSLLVGLVEVL